MAENLKKTKLQTTERNTLVDLQAVFIYIKKQMKWS